MIRKYGNVTVCYMDKGIEFTAFKQLPRVLGEQAIHHDIHIHYANNTNRYYLVYKYFVPYLAISSIKEEVQKIKQDIAHQYYWGGC